jgi:hypothetical protein
MSISLGVPLPGGAQYIDLTIRELKPASKTRLKPIMEVEIEWLNYSDVIQRDAAGVILL